MIKIKKIMKFKIYIICWPGVEKNAIDISNILFNSGEDVTVIYSTKDNSDLSGGNGHWIKVSDNDYYGRKFRLTLSDLSFDVMLHIHADAICGDWPQLVRRCKEVHINNKFIGVWSPTPDNSAWMNQKIQIANLFGSDLIAAAQTDCIVWSLTHAVANRLKKLDFERNNLGWGIDWAAITFCYTNNLIAVRDKSINIIHPKGTGYLTKEANTQMQLFLNQLTLQEKITYKLLFNSIFPNNTKSPSPDSSTESPSQNHSGEK